VREEEELLGVVRRWGWGGFRITNSPLGSILTGVFVNLITLAVPPGRQHRGGRERGDRGERERERDNKKECGKSSSFSE